MSYKQKKDNVLRYLKKDPWDSAQVYIQCMKCIGNPVVRTDGRKYVGREGGSSDYYVTTKDGLPNFLSNGAPLTR